MRKLRRTYTRYLPPWDRRQFGLLVDLWKLRADKMAPRDANEIKEKMQAADLACSWLGGIPSFLWDHEPGTLTRSDARKCLANTKLRKVSCILQSSADVSWTLFHFNVMPSCCFSCFQYTFCSGKVATLYSGYLCKTNVDKIRSFLKASQGFSKLTLLVANVVMIEVRANVAHYSHRPVLEAKIKAQQALKAWRDEFYQGHNNNDDTLLVFFLPPDSYVDFYHSSRKVSQKVVKGD
ncbi:hypothetical protein SELMODRAFT_411040 [Selaginella moellendorffii]|uniref:Uncharacterized protein n=1 Tax=Selaginella moellendorffii TaxID=88036 RepID=D8RGE4_SELML|nr:hypothetical protein SELMODRAFT_411040 [Selaginella moellendorffii]